MLYIRRPCFPLSEYERKWKLWASLKSQQCRMCQLCSPHTWIESAVWGDRKTKTVCLLSLKFQEFLLKHKSVQNAAKMPLQLHGCTCREKLVSLPEHVLCPWVLALLLGGAAGALEEEDSACWLPWHCGLERQFSLAAHMSPLHEVKYILSPTPNPSKWTHKLSDTIVWSYPVCVFMCLCWR